MMYRIYFDTNESDDQGRYDLSLPASRKDMAPIANKRREGLRVIIYMTGELEMEATLEFDSEVGR